jgi:hypothetical protein
LYLLWLLRIYSYLYSYHGSMETGHEQHPKIAQAEYRTI